MKAFNCARIARTFAAGAALGLMLTGSTAHAVSLEANSTYDLNGSLGLFLEDFNDGDTAAEFYLALAITGTVQTGSLNGQNAIDTITVSYQIDSGQFFEVGANNTPLLGTPVGSVDGGSQGEMVYTNAAVVTNNNGETGAAVYTSSLDPANPLPTGTGTGQLGASGFELSGALNGNPFDNKGVALLGNSMVLAGTIHEHDYSPFSLLGSFMASFGPHDGLGFSFHGWVTSPGNSFLAIGDEFQVAGDFHADLTLRPDTPPGEIPEPATWMLIGTALAGLGKRRLRSHPRQRSTTHT